MIAMRLILVSVFLTMVLCCLLLAQIPNRPRSPFTVVQEPRNIHIDPQYFGSQRDSFGGSNRSRNPLWPGVFYLKPQSAYAISLSEDEYHDLTTLLKATIDSSYHGYSVLRHLGGYYYEMNHGKIKRREYHIRYTKGDTIFVISGWPGKFLNFYRAVPDTIKYSVAKLQEEVGKLCPKYAAGPEHEFTQSYDGYQYFLEYIDRNNMMRIRCIFINEGSAEWVKNKWVSGEYYNLIEITRFIDQNTMPGPTFGRTGDISPYKK